MDTKIEIKISEGAQKRLDEMEKENLELQEANIMNQIKDHKEIIKRLEEELGGLKVNRSTLGNLFRSKMEGFR